MKTPARPALLQGLRVVELCEPRGRVLLPVAGGLGAAAYNRDKQSSRARGELLGYTTTDIRVFAAYGVV